MKALALVSLTVAGGATAFLLAVLAYIGLGGRRNYYR